MKAKYQHKTRIGQIVKKISIGIRRNSDINNYSCINKHGIEIKDKKIIFQTCYKIALNDDFITLIDRKKVDERKNNYHSYLEDCNVRILIKETYFANGVFGTIHTIGNEESAIKKLTKAMENKVYGEYGWLSNINVSEIVNTFLVKCQK